MRSKHFLDTAVVQHAIAEEEHEILFVEKHAIRFLFCEDIAQLGSITFPLAPELQRCAYRSITELHSVVGGDGELDCCKERRDEVSLV